MYLEHFGLQRQPFKITPDTSMFYTGNKRGAALEALKYAIASGEGIIKVVGEVGSGKTMLCRMLEVELNDNVEVVYIANPSLSPDNILHVIAFELKLGISTDSSKFEVMQVLQNYLLDKHALNKQVVVFVEEAQSMPLETLEEIRLLSNLETNEHKLLQMVLFGQPELDEKLRLPSIRQLKERITQNFYLDPFPAADVYKYLNFRMRAVGYHGPDLFSAKMATNIERKSNGLTRRINILADKTLLAAYSDGGHNINKRHINLAAKDSDFGQEINWRLPVITLSSVLIILVAIWIGTLLPAFFNTSPSAKLITPADKPSNPPYTQQTVSDQHNNNQATNNQDSSTDMVSNTKNLSASLAPARVPVPDADLNPVAAPTAYQNTVTLTTTPDKDIGSVIEKTSINDSTNPQTIAQSTSQNIDNNISNEPALSSLQQRIYATHKMLQTADDATFTIQLTLINAWSNDDVKSYLEKASQYLDINKLYVYKASVRGIMVYSVLYNDYEKYKQAVHQLRQLPPWLRQSNPYLRNIDGIRADIRTTRERLIQLAEEAQP